jgi:hypothetical protein
MRQPPTCHRLERAAIQRRLDPVNIHSVEVHGLIIAHRGYIEAYPAGLIFNLKHLDFHAIRHHGDDTVLEKHYVPRRSQRTRAVLTFFAQDHASTEMVYANSEITKTEQAREILAFADYWHTATGEDPGLLVFDSQLTTYTMLGELTGRGIGWLTPRKRGRTEIDRLAALPASRWKTATITRRGRYRRPQLHEDLISLKGLDTKVRQIAVRNIGHDEPTLLITNDLTTPPKTCSPATPNG